MAWRLAQSLEVLRAEVRSLHPGTTFWTIGDADHQDTWSDHNPNECCDVVCAADVLGNAGLNLRNFADTIVRTDPPALKYVIYNREIWFPQTGWQPYRGSNPHTTHVHVSVGTGPDGRSTGPYDNTDPWGVDMPTADEVADAVYKKLTHKAPEQSWAVRRGLMTAGQTVTPHTALRQAWAYGKAAYREDREQSATLAAILAAVGGAELPEVQEVIRAELERAADAERAERAAERDELVGPIAEAVAGLVDHELDTTAVEAAIRAVFGSLDAAGS